METPSHIDTLELNEVLGYGRDSIVFRAEGRGGVYAVKLQRSGPDGTGQAAERFRREAALAACLDHPSLPRVMAVGEVDGRAYLVREYIVGEALSERIQRDGPLSHAELVELARKLAGALAEVHRHRLVHRDVKPANVILERGGGIRLIDFGLTTRVQREDGQPIEDTSNAVGTLLYAAPEQSGMLRRPVDHRSDLYSLGVILFEAATGRAPFVARDAAELVRQHAAVPAPSVRQFRNDASAAVTAIVDTLLQKDPDDRYQSASALWRDLQRIGLADEAVAQLPDDEQVDRVALRLSRSAPHMGGGLDDKAARIVGRASELGRLRDHWREVVGGSGSIVLVEGPPGMGKSRLARTFRHEVHSSGALVMHAACNRDERTPYAALGRALSRLAQDITETGDRLTRERLSTALGPVADVVAGIAPELYQELSRGFARMPGQRRSEDAQHFHEALADLLLRLAQSHAAALLCIDDAHWLDDASARVLALVARRLKTSRLLVLMTAEPSRGDGHDITSRLGPTRTLSRMSLGALSMDGIRELSRSQLGGLNVSDALVRHVHTWSAGGPMAARNYLQLLLDMGMLVPWWGRWQLFDSDAGPGEQPRPVAEQLSDLALPEDMAQLLLRRIGELEPSALNVLTAAAVWGPRFRVSQLAATLDQGGDLDVHASLAEARRVHLIEPLGPTASTGHDEPTSANGEATYSWVHHLAYEALLASADGARLEQLHQRVAEALDDEGSPATSHADGTNDPYALARHYALGDRALRPDRVYATNVAAARLAMSRHANELALQFLGDAESVQEAAQVGEATELEDLRGEALARTGRYDQALTHFRRALAAHHDPGERASLRARMAEVLLWGRFETSRALAEVRAGLSELDAPIRTSWWGALGDIVLKWTAGRLISWTGIGRGGVSGEKRRRFKVLERLHAVGGLCAYFDVQPKLMAQMIGRSLYAANRLGTSEELVNNYVNHIVYMAVLGREGGSRRYVKKAREMAEALGDAALEIKVGLYANVGQHILGHSVRAQTAMVAYIAKNERRLPVWDNLSACADLGWNLLIRGYAREGWESLFTGLTRARVLSGEPTGVDGGIVRRYPSILWAANALTVIGRVTEGARLMARGVEFADQYPEEERYFRAAVASQQLAIALETGQLGGAAEDAIEAFEAAGVGLRMCPFYLRDYFVFAAYVRLEQCEIATVEERPPLLAKARHAVKRLAKVASHPSLKAHLAAAQAGFHRLAGNVAKAGRWLDRAEELARSNDNRWVRFQAQCERAKLLELAGDPQAATYEAELALATARESGWKERARRVEHRFGLAERDPAGRTTGALTAAGITRMASRRRTMATADAVRLQRHLDALLELSLASSMVLHPDQQARVALDEIVRLLNAERAFLFLYSEEAGALELAAGRGSDAEDLSDLTGYASTVVEQVWTNLEPMVVSGSEEGTVIASQSMLTRGIRSIIAAPLMIRDRLLGVIYLDSRVARGIFTEDDVQILLAVANHIAIALEAARSAQLEVEYQVERRERRLAEALRKATNLMTGTLEMGQVLMRLLESLSELVPHDSAAVLLREGEDFVLVAGRGYEDQELLRNLRIRRGDDPLLAQIEQTRRPLVIADVAMDTRFRPLSGDPDAVDTHSWIGVPLLSADEVIGMLTLEHHESGSYSEYDAEIALTFASQAAIGLDNARLFGEVQRLAVLDGLTGTFNRRHFFELAQREYVRSERYSKPLSLLMLDIDDFKKINDELGHPVGDEVLRVVAARLLANCRDVDVVGRYGGEEFAILLPETPLKDAAETFAERMRSAIGGLPVPTDRGPVVVTTSVGVACLQADERGLDGLIDRADQALLRAKSTGKNRVEVAE